MQVLHGFSKGVIGRDMYSDNTLRHMTKSELIELLKIAQHNYEAVLESYGNSVAYSEKLLKERDNGIREFAESLKEHFNDLECSLNRYKGTVSLAELVKHTEWILHEVAIQAIDAFVKEMVGEDDGCP